MTLHILFPSRSNQVNPNQLPRRVSSLLLHSPAFVPQRAVPLLPLENSPPFEQARNRILNRMRNTAPQTVINPRPSPPRRRLPGLHLLNSIALLTVFANIPSTHLRRCDFIIILLSAWIAPARPLLSPVERFTSQDIAFQLASFIDLWVRAIDNLCFKRGV